MVLFTDYQEEAKKDGWLIETTKKMKHEQIITQVSASTLSLEDELISKSNFHWDYFFGRKKFH